MYKGVNAKNKKYIFNPGTVKPQRCVYMNVWIHKRVKYKYLHTSLRFVQLKVEETA